MKRKTYRKLIKPSEEQLVDTVNELLESVNTVSASAETENYKGKPLEDMLKAQWYLNRAVEKMKEIHK